MSMGSKAVIQPYYHRAGHCVQRDFFSARSVQLIGGAVCIAERTCEREADPEFGVEKNMSTERTAKNQLSIEESTCRPIGRNIWIFREGTSQYPVNNAATDANIQRTCAGGDDTVNHD